MSETTEDKTASAPPPAKKGFSGLHVFGIVLLTIVATVGVGYWWLSHYVFPENFEPVTLNASEQDSLNNKLNTLGIDTQGGESGRPLQPVPYSEEGASREVRFSERELNGMLANNTDLAQRLAVDLSDDLLSAVLLVPLDEDFPVLGGRTLRVNAGVELSFANGRPLVKLRGVSLMGVPIPNAWLGNLKNVDLVNEFGANPGFWQSFAAGVDYIQVEDGRLLVRLKE
ncbi:arginine N-succinyltransferase [Marinobacter arenosus]|uniref:arginine N-succinyltransferase n=1 Tax=Marinobacter arenosus TaxID=2856822 RepID=UPI001C4BFCB2|nr:arginine N-succinyltransferase [Marinobacter arenosus]MBW0147224.1 arginine N-succinyltransferase [Marinobacter arenosus]